MSESKEVPTSVFRSNATDCSHRLLKFELTSMVRHKVRFPIPSHNDQESFQFAVYDLRSVFATIITNMSDEAH
jgi:hypothetical protein